MGMQWKLAIGSLGVLALIACEGQRVRAAPERPQPAPGEQLATFAGGCFWCMEPPFEGRPGVRVVLSGYTGGDEEQPTYEQVSSGKTGHTEAIQIVFDPKQITYPQLLEIFWRSMDPTDAGGQFNDRGSHYRPGIFPHDAEQEAAAKASLVALAKSETFDEPLVVEITKFKTFWPAEDYHQNYYLTHAEGYKQYRKGSGRVAFLERVWGEKAAWGHPEIEGVPNASDELEQAAEPSPAAPTSQPTSRPAGK